MGNEQIGVKGEKRDRMVFENEKKVGLQLLKVIKYCIKHR